MWVPHWLGGWALVGHISSSQLSSWNQFCFPRVSWLILLSFWPWSSMASCGNYQIGRWHKGLFFCTWWNYWGLLPSWIIWGGTFRCNVSACGDKPKDTSHILSRGHQWTTAWPYLPLWAWILPHNCPLPPSAYMVSYWPKILIFQVSPQGTSLMWSYRVSKWGWYDHFWYLTMSNGSR